MKQINTFLLWLLWVGMATPSHGSDILESVKKNKVNNIIQWIENWKGQETEEVFVVDINGQTGAVDLLTASVLLQKPDIIDLLIHRKDTFEGLFESWAGSALYHAIERVNTLYAVKLLASGASPNAFCTYCPSIQTPLTLYFLNYASFGNDQLYHLMMANGGDVNAMKGGLAPMHAAVIGTDADLVSELVEKHGGNPMLMTHEGLTPLWFAILHNQSEIADRLVAKGADPHTKTPALQSLLHAALMAKENNDHLIQWVFSHCSPEELVLPSDLSPVGHLLVKHGNMELIRTLVDLGLDLNMMDRWGRNVLFEIIHLPVNQREGMVAFLAKSFELQWENKDGYGKTILDYAKEAKDKHMIQLINKIKK